MICIIRKGYYGETIHVFRILPAGLVMYYCVDIHICYIIISIPLHNDIILVICTYKIMMCECVVLVLYSMRVYYIKKK